MEQRGDGGLVKADKKQVRLHFARAVSTYDDQATVQQRVADRLLALLGECSAKIPDSVLEIGCCTGILTRRITQHFPELKVLHVNDLVEEFSRKIEELVLPGQVTFLPGDVETLILPQQYQLIISSSTFHWFHDLAGFFAKLQQHLAVDGVLAFAMYGPDNLQEIRALTGTGLEYPSLEQLSELVEPYFSILKSEESHEVLPFQHPTAVLQHLRETGVNAVTDTGWSKSRLQNFIRQYHDRFSAEKGVCLTYHPLYVVAQRL